MRTARRVIVCLMVFSAAICLHAQQSTAPSEGSVDADVTITGRDDAVIPIPEPAGFDDGIVPPLDSAPTESVPVPPVLPPAGAQLGRGARAAMTSSSRRALPWLLSIGAHLVALFAVAFLLAPPAGVILASAVQISLVGAPGKGRGAPQTGGLSPGDGLVQRHPSAPLTSGGGPARADSTSAAPQEVPPLRSPVPAPSSQPLPDPNRRRGVGRCGVSLPAGGRCADRHAGGLGRHAEEAHPQAQSGVSGRAERNGTGD